MPTGYTSKLYEGKDQSFNEFVMRCARAFGALITMRDDPSDAPIPDEFTADSYYSERIATTTRELAEVSAWTQTQGINAANASYAAAVESWNQRRIKQAALATRNSA